MQIISEHEDSEHSPIDADEERILHGALQFSHRQVREVMTPIDQVIMLDEHQRLDDNLYQLVSDEGYSRYPVFSGSKQNIIGILYAKDLLTEDDGIAIKETDEALETDFMKVRGGALLDVVLAKMLKEKRHLAIVYNRNDQVLGVISLEDIIEEIIQLEIEDEDDD
ncbi:MAG: CBS domain-containing protein [Candidatus Paceibacterota bacterium]